jgi:hypothetical protein
MTFLSVYTPTYKRPQALARCKASVEAQTIPTEHIIIVDEIGIGIDGMYGAIQDHAGKVNGEYVLVLSDDNYIIHSDFAERLQAVSLEAMRPDVIVFKNDIAGLCIQPVEWGRVVYGNIDLSCFAVKRRIWQRHSDAWGKNYTGDFYFIHTLEKLGYTFHWWDSLEIRASRISQGVAE